LRGKNINEKDDGSQVHVSKKTNRTMGKDSQKGIMKMLEKTKQDTIKKKLQVHYNPTPDLLPSR